MAIIWISKLWSYPRLNLARLGGVMDWEGTDGWSWHATREGQGSGREMVAGLWVKGIEKCSKLWLLFSSVCWPCWYWLFVRPQQTDIKNCWNHWRRCPASKVACLQLWVLPDRSNGRRPCWPCVLLHQRLGVFSSIFFSSLGHSHFSWKSRIK